MDKSGHHFPAHHTSIAFSACWHLHVPLSVPVQLLSSWTTYSEDHHKPELLHITRLTTASPFSVSPQLLPHLHSGLIETSGEWNPQFSPNPLTPSGFSSFLPSLDTPADWSLNFSFSMIPDYLPPFRRLLQKVLKSGLPWLRTCLSLLGLEVPPGKKVMEPHRLHSLALAPCFCSSYSVLFPLLLCPLTSLSQNMFWGSLLSESPEALDSWVLLWTYWIRIFGEWFGKFHFQQVPKMWAPPPQSIFVLRCFSFLGFLVLKHQ